MSMEAANVLQWLMPSFLGCFAVTFLVVAAIARDLMAARWGGIFFITAALSLLAQNMLIEGSQWSIFVLGCMLALTYLISIKALVARKNEPVPTSVYVVSGIFLTIASPLFPYQMSVEHHHALLMAIPSLMLLVFAAEKWRWSRGELSDRLLYGSIVALAVLPAGAIVHMINPYLMGNGVQSPDKLLLYILHALLGMAGPIFGTNLLLAIGVDLVRREGARAMTDNLTGLSNRHALDEALTKARTGNWACGAAIILDLDHFKQVNDRHGHAAGDEVLREVGRMLRRNLGDLGYVYRLGGEEFLILVDAHQAEAASSMALLLRQAVAALDFAPGWPDLTVTASIGLCINTGGWSVEEAIEAADEALYRAKRNGRNRVVATPGAIDADMVGEVA